MLKHEHELGIPSNVMIFRHRVDRAILKTTGQLALTDYPLDIARLQQLESEGFVIGYHTNAYESGYQYSAEFTENHRGAPRLQFRAEIHRQMVPCFGIYAEPVVRCIRIATSTTKSKHQRQSSSEGFFCVPDHKA